jgi:16S rRNA U1498 N3-methylase RsmE
MFYGRMSSELRRRVIGACALGLLLSSCGDSSQPEMEQSRQMLQSWMRTVDLAAQQRAEQRVPDIYVSQVLRSAEQALARERRKIRQFTNADRQQLESLAHQLGAKIREQRSSFRQRTQIRQ